MKNLLFRISEFWCNHRKLSNTLLLFILVNSCFHGGSRISQDNLSDLFGVEFPPCRAANERGEFHDMDWGATGELIFNAIPSEDFYLSLDKKPRKKGYKYKLGISAPDLSPEAKEILGGSGYLYLTITKGDSIATYSYGSF